MGGLMTELTSSIPGIDEAMSFAELMKQVQTMEYSTIVFDTAPTGHTLRLIQFPEMLDKGLSKVLGMKDKFGGLLSTVTGMMNPGGDAGGAADGLFGKLEQTKGIIDVVQKQFQDPDITTFVCVCIPEFLSVYETERLVQALYKQGMDAHNIVVNQILHVPEAMAASMETLQAHAESCDESTCKAIETVANGIETLCARQRMQQKYLNQIADLYGDFNVCKMPLLGKEVRGTEALLEFSPYLVTPYEDVLED